MSNKRKYERHCIKSKGKRRGNVIKKRLDGKTGHAYAPCVECGGSGKPVTGKVVFPNRTHLHKHVYYLCACGAFVGSHKGALPLGYPAGPDTRRARHRAHLVFDRLWQCKLFSDREDAYRWLMVVMGMTSLQCHIGKMNEAEADRVTRLSQDYWSDHATEAQQAVWASLRVEKDSQAKKLRHLHKAQDAVEDEAEEGAYANGEAALQARGGNGLSRVRPSGNAASSDGVSGSNRPREPGGSLGCPAVQRQAIPASSKGVRFGEQSDKR